VVFKSEQEFERKLEQSSANQRESGNLCLFLENQIDRIRKSVEHIREFTQKMIKKTLEKTKPKQKEKDRGFDFSR
jgi:hypothetical protein